MTDPTDDADEIEAVLGRLPLRRPAASLDRRVAAAVARRPWQPARWAAAVAAVAAVVVGVWPRSRPGPAGPVAIGVPAAAPVSVERVTSAAFDDGVVRVVGSVPYRQVRRETVREVWWTDPSTGARLWAELPTEQVTDEPAETF